MSTDARREALNKLEQKYPDIFSKYDTEYEKLKNIKKIKEEIARLEAGESISNPANELKRVDDRIKELEGKTRLATEYYQTATGGKEPDMSRNPHVQGMRRQSFRICTENARA